MANQTTGGSTFRQKVNEQLNPQQNWQHQIHAAALAQKSDPMTMLGFVIGNRLLNPIMTNWLNAKFRPREQGTDTTVTGSTKTTSSVENPTATANAIKESSWEQALRKLSDTDKLNLPDYSDPNSLLARFTHQNFGKDVSLLQ